MPIVPAETGRHMGSHLRNALRIADWLHSELHLLVPEGELDHVQQLLEISARRVGWPEAPVVRGATQPFSEAVIEASRALGTQLLLVGIDPKSRWQPNVLETTRLPTLAIPVPWRHRQIPIPSLLVALSGERRESAALDIALRLASQVGAPVDLVHVTSTEPGCGCDPSLVGHYVDEFHQEYPEIIEALIAEASPYAGPRERMAIREFWHCHGKPITEIRRRARTNPRSLLVLEWAGSLARGRAKTVKRLLADNRQPVLLVKEVRVRRSRLLVGVHFRAA